MVSQLRVYRCPEDEVTADVSSDPNVHVRLRDLLPVVALAQKLNFIWLKDFLDDEVAITPDLHEVIQNFRSCKPTAS